MRRTLAGLAAAVALALTPLALVAGQAGAGVTGNVYTDYLAGFSGAINSATHNDDVRAILSAPAQGETGAPIPADTLVMGIAQQQSQVAPSRTFGIGWVWDSTHTVGGVGCGVNQYQLEYTAGSFTESPGVPVAPSLLTPAQQFDPVLLTFGPVCSDDPAGSYLELRYNVRTHLLHFIEGAAWNNSVEFATKYVGYQSMLVFGGGIDTVHLSGAASDLNNGSVAAFTSAKTTTRGGKIRNWSFYNLTRYQGTLHGGLPSVANPLTLTTSGLASTAFDVMAP